MGKITRNPYQILGLGLVLAGATFAPVAYFVIASVALTSVAISAIMIGFTSIALANACPPVSPEASELMLKTGIENTAALIEELGLSNKAIYLPSSMREGHPQALIPLKKDENLTHIRGKIPGRLIVRYGDNPEDLAIAVSTPGSINLDKLDIKPGTSPSEIETALTYVLIGLLDLASSVSVKNVGSYIDVEVDGAKLNYQDTWYYRCLGSPVASIVASVASEGLGKPIRIHEETFNRRKSRILLEVIS